MDINDKLILLIIFISTFTILVKSIRYYSVEKKGIVVATLIILIVTSTAVFIVPQFASATGLFVWITLLLLPNLGFTKIKNAIHNNQFTQARRWLSIMRYAYPFFDWQEYHDFINMSELAMQGNLQQAAIIFERYQDKSTVGSMLLSTHFYRLSWQWEQYLQWIHTHFPDENSQNKPLYLSLISYHIRALGEMGYLEEMLMCYRCHQARLHSPTLQEINAACHLFIFAFCGKTDVVKHLLQHNSLKSLSVEQQSFWLATAQLAANQPAEANFCLTQLINSQDIIIRNSASQRLAQHRLPVTLTELAQQLLTAITVEIQLEQQFNINAPIAIKKIYMTYLLITANLIMFALEIFYGGSENGRVLYELGSLIPIVVWEDGQWWRTVSSIFLHYGYVHLLFNMFALFLLGSFAEMRLKIVKYVLVYLTAGIGANLVFLWVQPYDDVTTVVGASGAIMGILGCVGALLLHGWRTQRAQVAHHSLKLVVVVLILQTIIDLSMAEISFIHHISGAMIGFVLTFLLLKLNRVSLN